MAALFRQVRREKISKRMNFLQDLVPGCNKVLLNVFPLQVSRVLDLS